MTQHDRDMTTAPIRVTVEDAAKVLGISVDAVRKRIERGTLRNEKRDGTRYVLLDGDMTEQDTGRTHHDNDMTPLIESLQDQIRYLREQLDAEREANRENRRLLAAALERIPELEPAREPPREPREAPTEASEEPGGVEVGPEQEKPVSWWQRLFGR